MAVHIVLEEIGEPYELELVSSRGHLGGVGTASPEWLAKNPKGRIPALSGVTGRIGGSDELLTRRMPSRSISRARIPVRDCFLPMRPVRRGRSNG